MGFADEGMVCHFGTCRSTHLSPTHHEACFHTPTPNLRSLIALSIPTQPLDFLGYYLKAQSKMVGISNLHHSCYKVSLWDWECVVFHGSFLFLAQSWFITPFTMLPPSPPISTDIMCIMKVITFQHNKIDIKKTPHHTPTISIWDQQQTHSLAGAHHNSPTKIYYY